MSTAIPKAPFARAPTWTSQRSIVRLDVLLVKIYVSKVLEQRLELHIVLF